MRRRLVWRWTNGTPLRLVGRGKNDFCGVVAEGVFTARSDSGDLPARLGQAKDARRG